MSSTKFECQKFSPNIFNKSKCQHCFRSKDQHSAEALECNRVSRKISKCGYLFVAPDWDFSVPMNRTKRWQRRWFVLYEDGELTYSVDEHPDTIPQAIIEMTKVVEVSDAEDVTGNKFAIAITAPDKIYFIKGTCKEESKWWFDVLVMYPRSLKGRQKRNATFPCIKATTSVPSTKARVADGQGNWSEAAVPRYRYLSCRTETSTLGYDQIDVGLKNAQNSGIKPLQELEERSTIFEKSKIEDGIPRDIEIILADTSRRSRVDSHYSKRCQKRESRKHQSQRSRSLGAPLSNASSTEDVNEVPPAAVPASEALSHLRVSSPLYARLSDVPKMKRYDSLESLQQDHHGPLSPRSWYQSEEGEENNRNHPNVEASSHDQLLHTAKSSRLPYAQLRDAKKELQGSSAGGKTPSSDRDSRLYPSSNSSEFERKKVADKDGDNAWREHTIRGDPDGCGLDHIVQCPSTIPEIRVDPMDLYSENILNFKKGWLMRQEVNKEWCKRWCILYGSSLKVYQDLKAEDSGNIDSIISMNLVQHVEEVDVGRNYGFKIKMSDNKCHIFSAVTAGIRSNWVYALKNAANVRDLEDVVSMGERIEREIPHMNKLDNKTRSVLEGSATKLKSMISRQPSTFSSEEELRLIPGAQAETPCPRIPEGDSVPTGTPSANSRTLPPSPPLNRTVISKVKERARLKTNVKVSHKSSKSPTAVLGETESEETDKVYYARLERKDGAERVLPSSAKQETIEDSKELGRTSVRSTRTKDRNRRYTLPGKNGAESKTIDVISPTKIPSRTTARPSKEKEMKWHGDHHCSSLFERNRLIEALQTRLQRSENKIHDLENEMEVLCKSHGTAPDGEVPKREDARLAGKSVAGISERKTIGSTERYQDEIAKLKEALDNANGELIDVVNRLQKATDENESLRKTFSVELGGVKKLPRVGSLSDLTNIGEEVDVDSASREALAEKYKELRSRFEKAVNEIKVLKKELKEAYGKCDELEVLCMNQKHNLAALETDYKSQIGLMSVRIEDLTSKFSNSEKQLRHQMRQRPASKEGKEQRRTRSLKGREALTVSKEVENKVEELEKKLRKVEGLLKTSDEEAPEGDAEVKKSTEGAGDADKQLHVFVRLNVLEAKVHGVSHRAQSLSSSRTSLATEVNLDDIETDEASLFNKSEGCPSDYETSDKDAPVALISELNGQIQGLRSRTFELELSLRGCRQKVEQCKDVVDALGGGTAKGDQLRLVGEHLREAIRWLDGTSTALGPALRDFFPDVLHRLNDLVLSKYNDFSGVTSGDRNLLAEQRAHRSSILNALSRALRATPAKQDCSHRILLEDSRRLGGAMQRLIGRLDAAALPQLVTSDDVPSLEGDSAELLEQVLRLLAKNETVIQELAAPWKEEKMLMLVGACLDEVRDSPHEVDSLPTAMLLREVFLRTQSDALRAMAEAEVVDVVARLLHGADSEALAWIQKAEEQKTRTVAEHLALEMDNVFHVLKSGVVVAAVKNAERGARRRPDGAMMREYAEVVTQAAFLGGSLAFLRSLAAATDQDCPGKYCGFHAVSVDLVPPRCPPPRVVGEVVKAGVKQASHCSEEAQGPWMLKESQDAWRRDRLAFGQPQDSCQQCKELQRKVQQMAEKYASDLLFETERHQAKLEAVYQEQALKLSALETNHSEHEEKYQKEILVLNEKLNSLEEDYESQILSLKEMFEQEISKRTNIKINKANVQRKYRAEIEQLKTLCEKGLLAMEHSNKRIIAELEDKHRRELEQMQVEKEQALAEETQATLAALDAMRKAHEAELQREVSRFKEEFLQKMDHSSADLDALHREHEEEMETIKHEILALSSKYSVKCLECAALEEHLEVMTQKLAEANSIIFDLTARNKQLRTHLKQNIRGLSTMVKTRNQQDKETMKDLQLSLQLKESQLAEKEEEIADLNCKLTATRNHENELENHCRSLDASLKADNKACEDDMGTLRARLEHIILAHQPNYDGQLTVQHKEHKRMQTCHHLSEPKSKRLSGSSSTSRGHGAELMRSPSCPGLSLPDGKVSDLNQKSGGASPPVAGVVASRKKIFEFQDGKRS